MRRDEDHLISTVSKQPDFSPEATFAPPAWYFEQDLWVQDAMAPGNAAHNYPLPMRIRGPLNHEALERSLQEIQRRHSVLRSVFRIVNSKTAQMIMPLGPLVMPVLDLSGMPEGEREAKAENAVLEDARRPFDLTRGPMLRTGLLRLGAEDHILLLTTHHSVCDYWSTRILARELFTLYAAFSARQPSPLPELGYQYGDFVRQLEARLQGKELESRLAFWKERLAGKHFYHLAPDHLPPVPRSYRGTHEMAIYPQELSDSIKLLGPRERLSTFMIMLAGLQCLLQRYSGHEDIGVGSCVANRPLLELEGLIGPFGNVSVLRIDLSGNPTIREVFRRVREVSLAAYSYQDTPFGMLVDNFQPAFDPARNPLFQTLFVFLNTPSESWEAPGLAVDPIPVDMGTSRFELQLNVRIQEQFEVDLLYSSDLFEAATVQRILKDYRTVLQTMCNNSDARICELPIQMQQVAIKSPQPEYSGTRYVAPNGDVESRLAQLWEGVLEKRPIGVNDNFFELGGDSLRASRLFAQIEQSFGKAIPLGVLFHAPTIEALAKVIVDTRSIGTSVVTIQSGHTGPPLFCLPGQTGSVLVFRSLAQHLGSGQPVYGLQSQGLDGKQPPLTRIEDMAANFVKNIRGVQPEGPYFIVGYCMGGTIALEMAQQLHRHGQMIGLLALLDTYNWSLLKRTSFIDDFYFRMQQWWFSWQRGGLRWKELRERESLCFLPVVALPGRKKSLRKFSDFWAKPAAELVSECNRQAAFSYVPLAFPGRFLHVRPTKQYARYKRPQLSLNSLASKGVEEFFLHGYPPQILQEPLVQDLAAKLRTCIDEAVSIQNCDPNPPTAPIAA